MEHSQDHTLNVILECQNIDNFSFIRRKTLVDPLLESGNVWRVVVYCVVFVSSMMSV